MDVDLCSYTGMAESRIPPMYPNHFITVYPNCDIRPTKVVRPMCRWDHVIGIFVVSTMDHTPLKVPRDLIENYENSRNHRRPWRLDPPTIPFVWSLRMGLGNVEDVVFRRI